MAQPSKASNLIKHGAPLLLLTIGGWLGLSYFVKGRLDVQVSHIDVAVLAQPGRAAGGGLHTLCLSPRSGDGHGAVA